LDPCPNLVRTNTLQKKNLRRNAAFSFGKPLGVCAASATQPVPHVNTNFVVTPRAGDDDRWHRGLCQQVLSHLSSPAAGGQAVRSPYVKRRRGRGRAPRRPGRNDDGTGRARSTFAITDRHGTACTDSRHGVAVSSVHVTSSHLTSSDFISTDLQRVALKRPCSSPELEPIGRTARPTSLPSVAAVANWVASRCAHCHSVHMKWGQLRCGQMRSDE